MSDGKFHVDVSALNLDDETLDRIGSQISKTVLSHLADDKRAISSRILAYPGHTDGIIIRPWLDDLDGIKPVPAPIPLYGVIIQEAVASGDLSRMKAVKAQAEQYLATAKDVEAELGNLRKSMK